MFHLFAALNYLTTLYSICLIIGNNSSFQCSLSGLKIISLVYDSSENSKNLFQQGIENGCQSFIISEDVLVNFSNDFHTIHDNCIQVYPNKYLIIYSNLDGNQSTTKWDGILLHASFRGKWKVYLNVFI